MKSIYKKDLDSLIYLCRQYWFTSNAELLPARTALGMKIESDCGLNWMSSIGFIDSIIQYGGLDSNADNRTIYMAFQLFGWDVVSE